MCKLRSLFVFAVAFGFSLMGNVFAGDESAATPVTQDQQNQLPVDATATKKPVKVKKVVNKTAEMPVEEKSAEVK